MRHHRTVFIGLLLTFALGIATASAFCDTTYTVEDGDSIWLIARRHHVSYLEVLRANGLAKDSILRPGQRITIPEGASGEAPSEPERPRTHVVARGDSLWEIARAYGVTVAELAGSNGLRANGVLRVGRRLTIPGGAGEAAAVGPESGADEEEAVEATYVVQPGDSLWELAREWGTSVAAIAAANGLNPVAVLRVGRSLAVPAGAEVEAAAPPEPREYLVQKGDTLWDIARWHGTTVGALAEVNGLNPDAVLRVGTRLDLPEGAEAGGYGSQLVRTAMRYRGVPYRWGGLTSRGMDCSGLIVRVLRAHGIDAPHYSKALYRLGTSVSGSDLQPGDLVFFHTTRPGISHVGLYVGNGQFIHASSGKGRVRVDTLARGYYRNRLVGARRVR
jgi:LysM repeat protein